MHRCYIKENNQHFLELVFAKYRMELYMGIWPTVLWNLFMAFSCIVYI